MNQETKQLRDGIQWLTVVLAGAAIFALKILYVRWTPAAGSRFQQLIEQCIPNIIAALIAVPTIYFIFKKQGIELSQNASVDEQSLATAVATKVAEAIKVDSLDEEKVAAALATRMSNTGPVVKFHDSFRHVDWGHLLGSATSTVDIVVFYFDSWVNVNRDALCAFFRRPNTRIRVFVADPGDDALLKQTQLLFPESSAEVLKDKISKTGERLRAVVAEVGGNPDRVEIRYVSRTLSYSAQCVDGRTLVLSIFEMFRRSRVDSPAIVLDLTRSEHMQTYWNKEREGLLAASKIVK